MKIKRNCLRCGEPFITEPKYIKRGHGKYCSPSCSSRSKPKKLHKPNATCSQCQKLFWRSPSRFKKSKTGYLFCCRKCKDTAQQDGGIIDIRPKTYTGVDSYRQIARRAHGKVCAGCGYKRDNRVLQVHHIDKDRTNNDPLNLAVVCPTCHREIHVGIRKATAPFDLLKDGGETQNRTANVSRAKGDCVPTLSPVNGA